MTKSILNILSIKLDAFVLAFFESFVILRKVEPSLFFLWLSAAFFELKFGAAHLSWFLLSQQKDKEI